MIPSFRFSLNKSFLVAASLGLAAGVAHAATITKANNTTPLNAIGSWGGGVVPGAADLARFDGTYATTGTLDTGAVIGVAGIVVTNPGGAVLINNAAASILGVGASGIDMSAATQDLTIKSFRLDASQTWNIATGRTFRIGDTTANLAGGAGRTGTFTNNAAGSTITVSGGGTVILDMANVTLGNVNWNITSGLVQAIWNGDNAFGSGTITLAGGGIAAGTPINGSQGNWTFANNITLGAATSSYIDDRNPAGTGRSLTLSGIMSGSGDIQFRNTAADPTFRYLLTGVNTYTGNTSVVTGATLVLSGAGSLGSGTYAGVISGAGGFTYSGTGTQILTGANTYTGATSVTSGTLSVAAGSSIIGTSGVTLSGTSTLTVAGTVTTTGALGFSTAIGSTLNIATGGVMNVGSISHNWNGTYNIGGTLNSTGLWTISTNAATNINGAGTVTAGSFTVGNASTVVGMNMTGTMNVTGAFSVGGGTAPRFNQTAGTLNLTSAAADSILLNSGGTGVFTLSGGTLNALNSVADINGGATTGTLTISGGTANFNGLKVVRTSGTGVLNLNGGTLNIGAGGIVNSVGTATINLGAGTLGALAAWNSSLAMTLTDAAVGVTVNTTGGNIALSGVLSGTGKLVKTGTGTLTLSGTNTYAGGNTVNAGTLVLAGGTYTGATTLSGNGTTLTLDYTNGVKRFAPSAALTIGAAGNGNFNTLTLSGGAVADSVAGTTLNGNVNINRTGGASTLNLGNLTGGGVISVGGAGIVKTTSANNASGFIDSGVLLKSGGVTSFAANDGAGNLTLFAGTVGVQRGGAVLPATTNLSVISVNNGAGDSSGVITLGVTGTKDVNVILIATDSSANGGATVIDLGASTLRTGTTNGVTGATGGITQLDTVTGTLTIQNGTLTAGGAANTAGTLAISNLSVAQNIFVSSVIANNGTGAVSLTKNGPGTVVLTGANTYTGVTTVNGGTLRVGNGGATGNLGSGNVVLGGSGSLVFNTTGSTLVAGAISGGGNITAQTGTVVLAGANTYTGTTTINAGATVQVGNGGTTGAIGTGALTNNGTLAFKRSDNLIVTAALGGIGAVAQNGTGTVAFSTQNTYTGGTTVNAGILDLTGGGGAAGVIRGTVTVNTGGMLRLSTGDATGYNTDASRVGVINLVGGTLDVNTTANQTLGSAVINMTGARITGIAGSNIDFFGGASALNTLASSTTSVISGATIAPLRQGNTTFNIAPGTTVTGIDLDIQSVIKTSNSGDPAGSAIIKEGAGKLVFSGNNTYSGAVTLNAGTLQIGSGGINGKIGAGTGAVVMNAGTALIFNTSGTNTVSGVISGAGTLSQIAAGTLTLSGSNTFTGGTTISAGTVNLSGAAIAATGAGSVGTGALTITGAGTIVNTAAAFAIERRTDGTNNRVVNIIGGTLNITAAEYFGTVNMTGGTLNAPTGDFLRASGAGLVFNSLASATTATINNKVDLTQGGVTFNVAAGTVPANGPDLLVAAVISENQGAGAGAKNLTKTGAGTLTLTGANSYTGITTISGGTIQVGNGAAAGALGTGAVVNNATLAYNRSDAVTVANAISGTGALIQLGAGTVTLGGANTYTGQTTVSTGTIRLGSAGAFNGQGAIAIAAGATFDSGNFNFTTSGLSGVGALSLGTAAATVNTAGTSVFGGVISGAPLAGNNSLVKTGVGTLVLTGTNDYTGATVINGGTLRLGNGGGFGSIAGSSSVTVGAAGTLAFNRSGNTGFGLNIGGAGGVTQQGPANSVVTLNGNNTYTGLTHVVTGTLKLGSASAFGGGAITIDTGATFNIGASAITLSTTALNGGGTLKADAGGNLTINAATDSTFAGSIAGFGNFVKIGAASFTLTGTSNAFTGTLNINDGSLVLGGATGTISNTGGTVNVTAPGALVFDHTAATTFGAAIAGTGGLTQRGAGATTITGLVSGGTAVTNAGGIAGALTLTNAANLGSVTNSGTTTIGSNAAAKTANTATIGLVTNTAGTLSVSSNITGAVAVTGGTVTVGADHNDAYAKLTGTATTVGPAGTLAFGGLGSYTVSGLTVTGTGTVEQAGSSGSTITLSGANAMDATSTVRVTSGTLAITDDTNVGAARLDLNAGTFRVGLVGGAGLSFFNEVHAADNTLSYLIGSEDLELNGALNGTGAIRFKGPGVLTAVNEGTFVAGGGQIVRDGDTLDIRGVDFNATNFDDDIGVTNNGTTAANFVIQQNQNGSATGLLSDGAQTLGLVKNGAGMLTLTFDNTYTGGTTINAGTLQLGNYDPLVPGSGTTGTAGTGPITINTAGTLAFNHASGSDLLVGNIATSTGTLSQRGAGLVTLTANTTVGNLTGGSDTDAAIGRLALDTGVTLTVDTSSGAAQTGDHYAGVLSGAGTLVKAGAGTLVLTGNSMLTQVTTVTGGILQLGNGHTAGSSGTGGFLGTGDVALTGGVTSILRFDRSDTVTFAGKITGSGKLEQIGTGTLVLTNRNTYSGGTVIGANSTLQVGNGTSAGDTGRLGVAVVQNSGTLVFNRTDGTDAAPLAVVNAITGSGDVIQRGPGTLTLTGTNSYTGKTRVQNGKLILNTASLPTGLFSAEKATIGSSTTTGTLVFSGTGAGTVQNGISGDGHVLFTGNGGVTTLKGASDGFNGDINIATGHTLRLGDTGAPVTIGSGSATLNVLLGGKLTGSGTVKGSLTSSGSIAPGFSPGVITVAGNFTTLGSLNMEIAGPGAAGVANGHDQVNYGGQANLGGTLNVSFTNGFAPAVGFSTTLLQKVDPLTGLPVTTAGSLNGNFVTVNVTGGAGRIITASDAIIFFNGSSLAQIPGLGLHDGVGAFADALSPAGTTAIHPQFAAFLSLNQQQGAAALARELQNASPVGLAALTAMPIRQASRDAEDVRRRSEMQTMAAATPFGDATDWLAYVGGSGSMLDADSDASSPSFDTRSYGGLAGLERRVGDGATAIGLRVGYDRNTATLHNGGGKIDQDHARGALYAMTQLGQNGYLAGSLGMGYSTADTKRNTLNGTTQKASPTGWDLSASLDGGYIFRMTPAWSLTPHAGVTVTQASVGGFTERGSDLALAVDGYSQTSAVARIGTGLYREWLAKNFTRNALRIGVDVSYEHTLFGDTVDIPASFANAPQAGSFSSTAPALIKDSVVVGPQVQWVFDESRSITAGYRFEMGFDGSTGQRADISFEQRF